VQAFTTTREQGASLAPFDRANLAHHVGDDINTVRYNRMILALQFNIPSPLIWLNQTHSDILLERSDSCDTNLNGIEADGIWTKNPNLVCTVMTADCLPLLLTDTKGTIVAAIHCGWRGIAKGIIEKTLMQMRLNTNSDIIVWMGPAIGPSLYEVGSDVYNIFVNNDYIYEQAFSRIAETPKYLMNIYQLARLKLRQYNVYGVYGGEYCTILNNNLFYSFRKEGSTGRMATSIWIS